MRLTTIIGSWEQHYQLITIITDCYVHTTGLRIEWMHLWTRQIAVNPKSRSLGKNLSTVASLTPSVVVVWADDGLVIEDEAALHP
jgi:hypothetical protein